MRQLIAYKFFLKEQWKPLAQNVIAVAYERWSFTRGFNYRALTGNILVFWIDGYVKEAVVAR